jgi:endonuclease/exonuclease/phosphatase family metal-dependent hydrolase
MTWNVHGSARPDIAKLADAIRSEAPDVLVLQEIRKSQATSLATELNFRYSWARKHFPHTRLVWWRAEGLTIMSPHAVDVAGHTELSDGERSWSWKRRIAQWALVGRADASAFMVYNLHLSPHDSPSSRRTEAVRLAAIVDEHGGDPPAVVAGDFNDALDSSIIYALPGIEHLVPANSSPADAPTQLLDHVLLPINAQRVSVTVPAGGVDWAAISDHLPVTVRFGV